jgi:23S rRNA (adenine2503-C2)-methyltransferase
MKIVESVCSEVDATQKFRIRLDDGLYTEVAYIDKNDGKDILCVSTHTGCNLKCKFCHTKDMEGTVRPLKWEELSNSVTFIYEKLKLQENNRTLLVSYMGAGDPLDNISNLQISMDYVNHVYKNSRFAISTLMPKQQWLYFFSFAKYVLEKDINLKVHLSLHFTNEELRKVWMPAATNIKASIAALEFYHQITNQPVEIHHTLIDGVNDSKEDMHDLADLLFGRNIPVKFLLYNKKDGCQEGPSNNVDLFMDYLGTQGIQTEFYMPPGRSVGASCGMFLVQNKERDELYI